MYVCANSPGYYCFHLRVPISLRVYVDTSLPTSTVPLYSYNREGLSAEGGGANSVSCVKY